MYKIILYVSEEGKFKIINVLELLKNIIVDSHSTHFILK